ncbi:MBL fold metallo-hydrolase [Actinoplanes awajinensis]|uniref:MBL fold metallo-hydrolase n=1 Tax=Actinoplanes awajinensis subsp. mycoplanecinus TaxID=135947 RepID=A0A101JIS1_9ACTN|nr:MBL fold metallo-hydrolase [Actinoplanes awajinensis]KUL27623.1 MBL fold metallo-hydrolase [Actinoplanes awajinensis subsp. mycoplanecinus]
MELIKHGHAGVTLEHEGRRLVIDPGGLTPEDVFTGAGAVLITHEHFDHFSGERLAAALAADPALQVWTNAAVARAFDGDPARVHVIGAGDAFTANGFEVRAYGQWHAELYPDIPRVANVGFLVDGTVFHPGDALTVPDVPVRTLLVPIHGPWSRVADLIDWVREVEPEQTLAIHDGALNPVGLAMLGGFLGAQGPAPTGVPYTHLTPGERHTLP